MGDAAGDENESMEKRGMRRQLDGMGGVGGASSTPTVAELTYRGAHIARSSYHCIVAHVIYPPSHEAQKPLKVKQNQKLGERCLEEKSRRRSRVANWPSHGKGNCL